MRRLGLIAFLIGISMAPVMAQAETQVTRFSDWDFDVRKAHKDNDISAFRKLIVAQPEFAKIWFFGRFFDLSMTGISEDLKSTIRPKLKTIAVTLAQLPQPDELLR